MSRFCAVLLVVALLLAPFACAAQGAQGLQVHDAWIRLLPGDLPAGGYFTLSNHADQARKLVSVSSTDFAQVMLHKSDDSGGMSRMHKVQAVTVPAHGELRFAPGGYHLMLMQRSHPIEVGATLTLILHFADGSTRDVPFAVRPANASGPTSGPAGD